MKEQVRRLNFREANAKTLLDISPDDIPTLVPEKVMSKWLKDDETPYYKIQKIDIPIKANGIIYERSFFESFLNKLKDRPIPGSKSGHEMMWGKRPPTDLLLVGGKLDDTSVYFKNYIPPAGETGDNSVFIRENESDMVHFSLASYTKDEITDTQNGREVHVVESVYGERNDAVEYGAGAMAQVTNMILPGVAGENNFNRGDEMDKDELLKKINSMRANGDITLVEIAGAMGLKDQVVTEAHRNAVALVDELKKMDIADPVAEVKRLRGIVDENAKKVRNAMLTETFGASEKDEKGNEKNILRQYADRIIGDVTGDEFVKALAAIKEDPIAKRLASDATDPNSAVNQIETGESAEAEKGPKRVDY